MSAADRFHDETDQPRGYPLDRGHDVSTGQDLRGTGGIPTPRQPGPDRSPSDHENLEPLLAAYAPSPAGSAQRARLRERLIAGYLPVAGNIARRYANRGEPIDDLIQIACIGLIKSIDRYNPDLGAHFLSYAVPTITGEIRRHFRDKAWSMRVPRRLKDLHVTVNAAVSELSQRLGRAPRPSEIATHLDLSTDTVPEALAASQAYQTTSLDSLAGPAAAADRSASALGEFIGAPDPGFELCTDSRAVAPYLAALPSRERDIVIMRFYHDMTQTQIAEKIGISQMHVSRLLSRTLTQLRENVTTDQPVEQHSGERRPSAITPRSVTKRHRPGQRREHTLEYSANGP